MCNSSCMICVYLRAWMCFKFHSRLWLVRCWQKLSGVLLMNVLMWQVWSESMDSQQEVRKAEEIYVCGCVCDGECYKHSDRSDMQLRVGIYLSVNRPPSTHTDSVYQQSQVDTWTHSGWGLFSLSRSLMLGFMNTLFECVFGYHQLYQNTLKFWSEAGNHLSEAWKMCSYCFGTQQQHSFS